MRQQELVYNAEFQIQQMERKVARGLGERSDEEKVKLQAVIEGEEAKVEAAKEKRKMLVTQCRKLNNELRGAQRSKAESEVRRGELEARITELALENTSAEQSLKATTKDKEEAMVQNDVMRLELKRLRSSLSGQADKVFALENRKQQLMLSMEERKHEIGVHKEVQRAQLRASQEEKHKVTVEMSARKAAVEKLRAKYETLMKAAGKVDGEGVSSQAAFLIAAAQRREEMQREGDELDQAIRKTEREMRALIETLKHLNVRNTEFRKSFQKADANGSDFDELRQLEEQAKLARDALFRKKKELQRLQTDYEEDTRRLEQVNEQLGRQGERGEHLEAAKQQMQLEIDAQADLLERADQRVGELAAAGRVANSGAETVEEKQLRAEARLEVVQSVLHTLGQVAKEYPEIKDALNAELERVGLNVPDRRPAEYGAQGGVALPAI